MLTFFFTKQTEEQKELADSIRQLETLKVSRRGSISLESREIINSDTFVAASKKAKRIVQN